MTARDGGGDGCDDVCFSVGDDESDRDGGDELDVGGDVLNACGDESDGEGGDVLSDGDNASDKCCGVLRWQLRRIL